MNLGFDFDEVISNTVIECIKKFNKDFKHNITLDMVTDYDFSKAKLSDDEDDNIFISTMLIEFILDDNVVMKAKPFENAGRVLRKLKRAGHKIYIITKRKEEGKMAVVRWLRKYKIPFTEVITVGNNGDKGKLANRLRLDFFVDDLEDNLYDMYNNRNRWTKGLALMDRPWNSNKVIDSTKFTRVHGWLDILRLLGINNRLKT
jgi:uncharacterized HAD superfamily protein